MSTQKGELLAKYCERAPTAFLQFDGFFPGIGNYDPIVTPDSEGDCLFGGDTWELMHGADVRVLIKHPLGRTDALRILSKITAWVNRMTDGQWGESMDRLTAEAKAMEFPF